MIIAILGATGLTGNLCLIELLNHNKVDRVYAIVRNSTDIFHPKLNEVLLDDLEAIGKIRADAFISCIGTTIKKAGSQAAFTAVDLNLPLSLAKKLNQNGCKSAAVISAMGANASSSIFYNRIKGKMEEGMKDVGFRSLAILRPSIISGNRNETRLMERLAIGIITFLGPLFFGAVKNYRVIKAHSIAKALANAVFVGRPGEHIYLSEEIKKLAKI